MLLMEVLEVEPKARVTIPPCNWLRAGSEGRGQSRRPTPALKRINRHLVATQVQRLPAPFSFLV